MDNVVLFGFMGCGKSTVGALLARKTGRPLLDTDGYLEQKYGRSIPQIFASDGEEAFRRMERQVCRELAGREGLILCCGGGNGAPSFRMQCNHRQYRQPAVPVRCLR